MRIISRFQDYYDRAMAHGADLSRVFMRESKEYADYSRTNPTPEHLKQLSSLVLSRETRGRVNLEPFIVAFAGKLYPGIQAYVQSGTYGVEVGQEMVNEVFYDLDSFLQFAKKQGIDLTRKFFWDGMTQEQRFAQFFELRDSTRCSAMLAEHGIAIALAGSQVIVNPQLKAVQFFRVMDAWQTYQELEMYLGALAAPDTKPPVQVADKDRIAQHGFNNQSFRTRPKNKTSAA